MCREFIVFTVLVDIYINLLYVDICRYMKIYVDIDIAVDMCIHIYIPIIRP